ncbi:endoplasmic reticulum-golgi intermediate compartment protein 3 [Zychaea mexicana]|uniref:endoplasmic reticulum-golgi intermediate compartment protein 3 n=1 Tax=Zychaea mexicana TaxID=64656 RepID=UPI0022FE9D3B|nr:endoplasmic reticulum-golgi intermediate compartment protein 3 [Zychaea mexicana]KAI9489483.1 endoplasmic reticulum-golgi intermediate compartment protein 3 [Zychaea mexicana]
MAKQGSMFLRFRQFDAYAKTLDDFRVKTTAGAAVTVISALIIIYLVLSELVAYRTPIWDPELVVDKGRKEKMNIQFNVTFPKMPCHMLSIDIMDDSGEHITGYTHDVYKVRLDPMGVKIDTEKAKKLGDNTKGAELALQKQGENECGSCFGAKPLREDGCCNSCDDIRQAYAGMGWGMGDMDRFEQCVRENWREKIDTQANEGCNLHGQLQVNKVRGNFHIAPGKSFQHANMHLHNLQSYVQGASDGHRYDMSHEIHHLKFGPDPTTSFQITNVAATAAVTNALAGTRKMTNKAYTVYQYFLKIVSTQLQPLSGNSIYTNQYSVTQSERTLADQGGGLPGVFFIMDISPMLIIYREDRRSFASFLTGVCAIVGGIFTVAGLFDRVVYRAERALKKKRDLGKTL